MQLERIWLRFWVALFLNVSLSLSTLICSFDGSFRSANTCFSAFISGGGNTFCVYETADEQLLLVPVRMHAGHSYYFGTQAQSSLAAEWMAFIELLYSLTGMGKNCVILGDSDVIINSMNQYPYSVEFKDATIMKHYYLANALLHSMTPRPVVKHIPRHFNVYSDWLANEALSSRLFQKLDLDNMLDGLTQQLYTIKHCVSMREDKSGLLFIRCDMVGNITSSYANIYKDMRIVVTFKSSNGNYVTLVNRLEIPSRRGSSPLSRNNIFAIDIEENYNANVHFSLVSSVSKAAKPFATATTAFQDLVSLNKIDMSSLQWKMIQLSAVSPTTVDEQCNNEFAVAEHVLSHLSIQAVLVEACEPCLHRLMYSNADRDRDIFMLSECLLALSRRSMMETALQQTKPVSIVTLNNMHNNNYKEDDKSKDFTICIPKSSYAYVCSSCDIFRCNATLKWQMTPLQMALLNGNSKMAALLVSQAGAQCGIINDCEQDNSYNCTHCDGTSDITTSTTNNSNTVTSSHQNIGNLHLAVLSGRVGTVSQFLRAVSDQIAIDAYTAARAKQKLQTVSSSSAINSQIKAAITRRKSSLLLSSLSTTILKSRDSKGDIAVTESVVNNDSDPITYEVLSFSSSSSSTPSKWTIILKTLLSQRDDKGNTALELAEILKQDAMVREIHKFMRH